MSSYLTGMNVLVTGASDGIGAAIAQQLAKQGGESLILAGRDRSRLEKTARSVEVPCQLHVADLSVQTGVDQLLDDLAVRFIKNSASTKYLVREMVMSSTYRQSSLRKLFRSFKKFCIFAKGYGNNLLCCK